MSESLHLQLGSIQFQLQGLGTKEEALIREAWGPFILGQSKEIIARATIKEYWSVQYHKGSPPKGTHLCYQRLGDLWLSERAQVGALRCADSWTDGSHGAIEATIQVLLQWSLQAQGGLLVHASAGVHEGRGILVPGASGAGKSTIAREAGFDIVLSDEMVIVDHDHHDQEYHLYSTPFWSEGRRLPLVIAQAPLRLLAVPHKADYVALKDCSKAEAVRALMRGVTIYERSIPMERGRSKCVKTQAELFTVACELCAQVKSANLFFPKRGPWLPELSGALALV